MDTLVAVFGWITANYDVVIGAVLAIIGGLSVIAKLTPTPKDDAILAKIITAVDFLALNKPRAK